MTISDIILDEAMQSLGVFEWAGKDHNPKVLAMYADAGHPEIREDEVPWCAAFVGSVLAKCGLQNTGSLLAKSYLHYGHKVTAEQSRPGDIVIFDRGTEPWQGHVAFLVGWSNDKVKVIGGNQNNQVSEAWYPRSKIVGIRRPTKPKASAAESTTLQTSTIGLGSLATGGLAALPQLNGTAQNILIFALVIAAAAFMWIFRERIKKFAAGVR